MKKGNLNLKQRNENFIVPINRLYLVYMLLLCIILSNVFLHSRNLFSGCNTPIVKGGRV